MEKLSNTGLPPDSLPSNKKFALKFITGKFVGGVFNLPSEGELIIGRGSDADIIISEDNVSRKHARLTIEGGNRIFIEDLKSTNGTFVNTVKIQKTSLSEGDRILIGTTVLKLISASEESKATKKTTSNGFRPSLNVLRQTLKTPEPIETEKTAIYQAQPQKVLEGSLKDLPLTDVIQMCSSTRKSGVLTLEWGGRKAEIYIKSGNLVYAVYSGMYDMPPRKALFRLIGLNEGKFALLQYIDPPEFSQILTEPTEFLIMEGIRRFDEQNAIENELKLRNSKLEFSFPLPGPLKNLQGEELDIFQILYKPTPYELLLDLSPYEDLETAQIVKKLLEIKYIKKI